MIDYDCGSLIFEREPKKHSGNCNVKTENLTHGSIAQEGLKKKFSTRNALRELEKTDITCNINTTVYHPFSTLIYS